MDKITGRRARTVIVGSVLCAIGVVAGCGSSTASDKTAPAASSAKPTTSAAAPAGPKEASTKTKVIGPPAPSATTPSPTVSRPADPLASSAVPPVARPGVHPKTKLTAPSQVLTRSVVYSDGVSLRITGMTQSKVSGQGPGIVTGEPTTAFAITLTNKSAHALALNQVVVTATYGSPARVARPYYGPTSQDFGPTVQPNGSAKAVYTFSIPTKELSKVTIAVDFDGTHAAAIFRGAAR